MPRIRETIGNPEFLLFLAVRDIKVRYAQTALGWIWTIVQPLGMMLVFTLAFQRIGKIETQGVPYPLFVFTGLAFWTYFSRAASQSAESLVTNVQLVTKTSCPRLSIPLSAVLSAMFDLLITFTLLLIFSTLYGEYPSLRLAVLPLILVVAVVLTAGLGILLSAVNVQYRDIRNALPFTLQLLLFLSPVAYPLTTLGTTATTILSVNPLVAIVEGFRWSVIGTPPPTLVSSVLAIAITGALFLFALRYFSRVARNFADIA